MLNKLDYAGTLAEIVERRVYTGCPLRPLTGVSIVFISGAITTHLKISLRISLYFTSIIVIGSSLVVVLSLWVGAMILTPPYLISKAHS
ncbi:MAG: hypothetical protein [Circular genetic element sp.]|nr:MAG: hypothetical protein [Circular genetic element sp.]